MSNESTEDFLYAPTGEDQDRIRIVSEQLAEYGDGSLRYFLVDERERVHLELPRPLFLILSEVAKKLSIGNSVVIMNYNKELTTQQAADLLGVSRPYLIRLLEDQQIPFHMVGTHRRIRMQDLSSYKERRDALRREKLQELIRASEELGLYDDAGDDRS